MDLKMLKSFNKLEEELLIEASLAKYTINTKRDKDDNLILPIDEKSPDDDYWTQKYLKEHPNAKI